MITTCNQLNLETLGFLPIMPKNLPRHCLKNLEIYSKAHVVILSMPSIQSQQQLATHKKEAMF